MLASRSAALRVDVSEEEELMQNRVGRVEKNTE
jgi:hypothetical protein